MILLNISSTLKKSIVIGCVSLPNQTGVVALVVRIIIVLPTLQSVRSTS